MSESKYPDIEVQLVGNDGNAFAILRAVVGALRRNSVPKDEIDMFLAEAKSGDYQPSAANLPRLGGGLLSGQVCKH